MADRPLTGKSLRKLFREWTHDFALRRMEDRGLKYEDQRSRPLDRAQEREASKPPETTQASDARSPKQPDHAARAQFQNQDKGRDHGR
jgi:hypothetical protein